MEYQDVTYPLLHIRNNLLHLGYPLPRKFVFLRRVDGCEIHLLVLQVEPGGVDGGLELLGSLLPQGHVDRGRVASLLRILLCLGDGCEFQRQGHFEVRLGDDLALDRVELCLVGERLTRVLGGL